MLLRTLLGRSKQLLTFLIENILKEKFKPKISPSKSIINPTRLNLAVCLCWLLSNTEKQDEVVEHLPAFRGKSVRYCCITNKPPNSEA